MDESVIFSHKNVIVSYKHFRVDEKSYPLDEIKSVHVRMLKPKWLMARLFMFSGLALLFGRAIFPILGLILMLSGFLFYKRAKVRYALVFKTTASEYLPLFSEEIQDIENVTSALNVALSLRDAPVRNSD